MDNRDPQSHATVSLSALLSAFVQEAEAAFPHIRGQLVLYNVRRQNYYVTNAFNSAARGFKSREKFGFYLANHEAAKAARSKEDSVLAYAVREKKPKLSLIIFNEKVQNKELHKLSPQRAQELLATLDHELAHLVIKDAYNEDNDKHGNLVEETVAEAFAQLMHFKRFGVNARYADGSGTLDLARSFLFHQSDMQTHFYYPAIKKIVACRHIINFQELKTADLADLARRFALQYTPSNANMADLDDAFAACRKAYRRRGIAGGMQNLARIALTTPHPHVARMSVDLFLDIAPQYPSKLQGEEWQAIIQQIKELDAALGQEPVLYRVPKHPPVPTHKPPQL